MPNSTSKNNHVRIYFITDMGSDEDGVSLGDIFRNLNKDLDCRKIMHEIYMIN